MTPKRFLVSLAEDKSTRHLSRENWQVAILIRSYSGEIERTSLTAWCSASIRLGAFKYIAALQTVRLLLSTDLGCKWPLISSYV